MKVASKYYKAVLSGAISVESRYDERWEAPYFHRWVIRFPSKGQTYEYTVTDDDDDKFFEDGFIYNIAGSVADNALIKRRMVIHTHSHTPLDTILAQPDPILPSNFLYSLPVGNLSNAERIVAVRDRLHIPDWLALFVYGKLVDEDSVKALLVEVPNFFKDSSLDWVFRVLNINQNEIMNFGSFDEMGTRIPCSYRNAGFKVFRYLIELEKQNAVS